MMTEQQSEPIADVTSQPATPPTKLIPARDEAPEDAPAGGAPVGDDDVDEDGNPAAPAVAAPTEDAKPDAQPEKAGLVAEVMKKRDVKQLAALVRDKKQLEAEKAQLKEQRSKLEAVAKIERLLEDEDPAAAIEALLSLKYGDKGRERLADAYNALTDRMLKSQSQPQTKTRAELGVSRLERELEELKARDAQREAELAKRDAEDHARRVQGAKDQLGQMLKATPDEFEYLLTEADAPEEIVWEILEEADRNGQEMTFGEAAKLANLHFQPAFERKAQRYKQNSLAPTKANGVPDKQEAPTSKSAPQRKSLTNADASEVPETRKPPPAKTEDERLDRGWNAFRQGLTK
jgi:hypothetical protein